MFPAFPFSLGVASGAPRPTGVVLWTRLAPDPLNGGGLGPRASPSAGRSPTTSSSPASRGRAPSTPWPLMPTASTSEVTGLEPDRWYFFRFMAGERGEPDRPHAHGSGRNGDARTPALRVRLLPQLRARLLRRPPSRGRRGARPHGLPRRLHLRVDVRHRAAPPPRRRRGTDAGRVPDAPCPVQDRPGPPAARTPPCPGWSRGTTTRSTTTTRATARRASTPSS